MDKTAALTEKTEFLLYTSSNGEVKVDVFFHNENIWLTPKRMAELFDVEIPTINEHLKNIFSSGELDENSVIRKFLTTANDGKNEICLLFLVKLGEYVVGSILEHTVDKLDAPSVSAKIAHTADEGHYSFVH